MLFCNIWMYGSKNILFMLPLFNKQKSHKFSNFPYPGSRKVLTSTKTMISSQKCCRYLMLDSVKYLCALFGYDWTKVKKLWLGEGGDPMDHPPSTYLTSKKSNRCSVNQVPKERENLAFSRYLIFRYCRFGTLRGYKISQK